MKQRQKKDYATAAMTGDEQTRRRIIMNDCPVCGARPGNPCVTTRGNHERLTTSWISFCHQPPKLINLVNNLYLNP